MSRSWHLIPTLFCSPYHQLSMVVKQQVHKIYVQLFSKICFKVILLQKGAKGLRALKSSLNQSRSSDICSLAGAESAGDRLSIAKCVG